MAKRCIGLDIGSSAVKLVQLKSQKRGLTLQNFGIEPLPAQSIVDGSIMNHGAIVDAIRNLASRIHLRGKDVAVAVSGNSVIIKRITIPAMEGDALDEQMKWEVQQNIPFRRDDVNVDHTVLVEKTPEGQMEVLLVAAKKDVVEQYLHAVRDAGFVPVVVDTAAFAAQNAVEAGVGMAPGEVVAIINVGARLCTISIVDNGMPVFTRDIGTGGNTYTDAIQSRLAIDSDGAEAYKVGGASPASADMVPQEVHRVLAQVSEQIAGELQRSIDFFLTETVDGNLARIYLTGGSSLVPQLPKAIQDRSRIPVHILDPFVQVEIDARRFDVEYLRANAPVAAVAFGLALRRQGDAA
ncbi:MAG: type IV pilus assembly protein PilM [Myxococcales bacterium FL481]|nr:MAG: type IV pilus assembly protein PilM [Myxococcales bacterium FL481]